MYVPLLFFRHFRAKKHLKTKNGTNAFRGRGGLEEADLGPIRKWRGSCGRKRIIRRWSGKSRKRRWNDGPIQRPTSRPRYVPFKTHDYSIFITQVRTIFIKRPRRAHELFRPLQDSRRARTSSTRRMHFNLASRVLSHIVPF